MCPLSARTAVLTVLIYGLRLIIWDLDFNSFDEASMAVRAKRARCAEPCTLLAAVQTVLLLCIQHTDQQKREVTQRCTNLCRTSRREIH
jgi:hypothetical protein